MNARYVLLKRRRPLAYAPLLKGYRTRKSSSCVSAVCCWWLKCSYVRTCNHFFIRISLFWWCSSVYSFSDQPPITPQLLLIVCTPVSTHISPPSPLNWRKKPSGWLCVVPIHGSTLDARRSEWCVTLRVNHCIFNPCPPSVRALFLHNRTANDPGAFKNPPRFPIWQWFTSYLVRLLHPSARTHLAARILRGMLSQSYAPVASASSATNLSSPIRLSPYCCVAPSARRVRIGTALSVWCFSII